MKPFVLDARRTLVLLIDMQEKLMPAIAHREDIERMGSLLLRCADAMGVPVLVSEHYTKGLGKTVPSLVQALPEACPVVEKISFSCWGEPEIVRSVERAARRQIVLFGVETHICVLSTALELLAEGYDVVLVSDATGSRQDAHRDLAFDALRSAGGLVLPTESVAYQLLGKAGTELFKRVLPFFKA